MANDTSFPLGRICCGPHFREMTVCCFATIADVQFFFAERAENDVTAWFLKGLHSVFWRLHWLCKQTLMDSAPNWSQITPPSRVLQQEKHTYMSDRWGSEQRPKGKVVQGKELFWPLMIILLQHQEMAVFVLGQKWGKHQVVFSGDNLWHLYMWVSLSGTGWLGIREYMTLNVCLCSAVF